MATRIAISNGNFTSAGTWLTVDATSLVDSEAANTALTTAYQNSTAFTPGAIIVDGVAIKIASRAAGSPTNTITVRLGQGGVDVTGTPTTMNVSDIAVCTSINPTGDEGGWYYFRFNVAGTPTAVTLLTATAYTVGVKLSATTTAVNLFSLSGTNWSQMLATTTTGAPAAGDRLAIAAAQLAAGSQTSTTVTMDNTATTSFGTTATQAFTINNGGTLTWGTSASTNYYLKIKGITRIFSGGTYNRGSIGTRMPSTSTAIHEFDCTVAVDSGIEVANGGTLNDYGASKVSFTVLTIDKAAGNTVISGLTSTSGWLAADDLIFESSTTTSSQVEKKTILTVDSATQVTLTAGLTNAHSGTSPTQIQVGNLIRTNKFRGVSASLVGYVFIALGATVVMDEVEATALGNSTGNKRGIDVLTSTGSCTINNCSVHDSTQATGIGINITGAGSLSNNYTISNNVVYNMNATGVSNAQTNSSNYTISGNLICFTQSGAGSGNLVLGDLRGTITNNITSSASSGASIIISATDAPGTFSGNVAHSSASGGMSITGAVPSGTLSTISAWRNTGSGITITGATEAIIDSGNFFGNSTSGIAVSGGAGRFEINNSTFNAGTTLTQPIGLSLSGACSINLNSTTFGATTTHATDDINIGNAGAIYVIMNNCLLASATEVGGQGTMNLSAYIGSEKHDQTSGNNKTFRKAGNESIDTVIFDVAPSLRLTPINAALKLGPYAPFKVAVASGTALTISIKVRQSVIGDGTAYNGNLPRLIMKKNYSLGITSDTVLATATAASSGAFETIMGTTATASEDGVLDFVVDCDGTTGWINVDTFTSTPNVNTTGFQFWENGTPVVYGNNSSASSSISSYTFS